MLKNKLFVEQLDQRLKPFIKAGNHSIPPDGWIQAIRTAMNMSLRQLGRRLALTPQGIKSIEKREKDGSLTLKHLREVAEALDMEFVYGLVPREGTLEAMLERKAREKAENKYAHFPFEGKHRAIQRLTERLKEDLPKSLWD